MSRSIYEDRYSLGLSSSLTTASGCTSQIDGSTISGILPNEHPSFDYGVNITDQRKAVGSANRLAGAGAELQNAGEAPAFQIPFDVNSKILFSFLHTFFQKGNLEQDNDSSTSTEGYAKWFFPWTWQDHEPEAYMTFVRDMGFDANDNSQSERFYGGVCNTLELSSDGGNLNASASFIGYDVDLDHTLTNEDFTYSTDALLQWKDAHVHMAAVDEGSANAPEDVPLPGFSLTLNNGAVAKMYNSANPERIILNEFTGDGTITLPWNITPTDLDNNEMLSRFIAGESVRLIIYWDADTVDSPYPNANNQVSLAMVCRYTDAGYGGEDELETELPFTLVEFPIFSTEDGNITGWEVSGNNITVTFDYSTNTTVPINNIFPGDRIICHDAVTNSEKLNTIRKVQYVIPYDSKATADFSADEVVTGGTSGTKAVVVSDSGTLPITTGELTLEIINGAFQEDETISGTSGTADIDFASDTKAIVEVVENAPTGTGKTYTTIYSSPISVGLYDNLDRSLE